MAEDLMNFDLPQRKAASIKVIGVGGGGNAVNHMYQQGIKDVEFIVCNTDLQDLQKVLYLLKYSLAMILPEDVAPEVIRKLVSVQQKKVRHNSYVARRRYSNGIYYCRYGRWHRYRSCSIIAEIAKEMGILTVGIVTIPFSFEGKCGINMQFVVSKH